MPPSSSPVSAPTARANASCASSACRASSRSCLRGTCGTEASSRKRCRPMAAMSQVVPTVASANVSTAAVIRAVDMVASRDSMPCASSVALARSERCSASAVRSMLGTMVRKLGEDRIAAGVVAAICRKWKMLNSTKSELDMSSCFWQVYSRLDDVHTSQLRSCSSRASSPCTVCDTASSSRCAASMRSMFCVRFAVSVFQLFTAVNPMLTLISWYQAFDAESLW
mmetsp:Transcript_17355/g.65690  ORF Transcript_17355/g.65690 Transcript_17355/m.65690 type:complete len:225 (-) Transcript_17355:2298-2972(-)